MKRALVVGSAGQDGRILVGQLRERGDGVVGLDRHGVIGEGVSVPPGSVDLLDRRAVEVLVSAASPDEVYYLAAHHHSSEEATDADLPELFRQSLEVNVTGLVHVLDALARRAPRARSFYAASSHVFGAPTTARQNEETPQKPVNVYGITKAMGMDVVRFYRGRGLHVSAGILYNHESIHRPDKFVSMRLVRAAQRAAHARKQSELRELPATEAPRIEVGSLAAVVDWGYARDYTIAMQRIVAEETPTDYVVATGEPHTVADFADAAFSALGLDYRAHVSERAGVVKAAAAAGTLVGDARKLREATGWAPTVRFSEMVSRLALGELDHA